MENHWKHSEKNPPCGIHNKKYYIFLFVNYILNIFCISKIYSNYVHTHTHAFFLGIQLSQRDNQNCFQTKPTVPRGKVTPSWEVLSGQKVHSLRATEGSHILQTSLVGMNRLSLCLGNNSQGSPFPQGDEGEGVQVQSVTRGLTHRLCSQWNPGSNPTFDTCRLGDLGQVT
jgi:hypothetical protein